MALRAGETAKKLALQFQAYHKSHADLLHFAASLEQAAVNAYLGAVSQFSDKALYKAAASMLGDEAVHWAVLRYVLGEDPVPAAFVS